ncbi:MAG: hypothetical protein A3K41_00420 [Chloroflexi bacterium RIFOXYD12_FULL_57_15]|nr:MAG: hypothetical protein A3K41_00420 [Chloroflexi bacterium RIFOXYD12_FULL_57_15]
MKKNLSILLAVVILLSAMLACGSDADTGSSGGGSSNSSALVGVWVSDNGVVIGFGDDGTFASNSGDVVSEGTYTFDGSTVVVTLSDGTNSSAQVEINGDAMTMTDPNGSVSAWTKQQP